jgi:predicted transcriptional regulator
MKNKPTESELEVLALLWQNGPMTVREVHNEITKEREVGYTTTLKIMQIMFEKGLVERQKQGKGHLYSNNVDRQSTQNGLLAKMINTVFQGSTKDLVVQALGQTATSQKELEEIRQFLDQLDKDADA